ncbi:hypothetical protein LTS15_000528 [Exophiala xenobiotica]|nr:hypothetical protein LTS15_000528 [Exophiala xenobiotica]
MEGSHQLSPEGGRTSSPDPNTLLNSPLILPVRDFDPDLHLDADQVGREQAAFEAFLSSSPWNGDLIHDNSPSQNQQDESETILSTQQFGNLNYDIADDHNQEGFSSNLYDSAANLSEEFDFNNINRTLPVSNENIFEFVDFDDLPVGDDQLDRSTRLEEPAQGIDFINPVGQAQVPVRGRDYWAQQSPSPPPNNAWVLPEPERHVLSPGEYDLPPLNFTYLPVVDDGLFDNLPPPTQPAMAPNMGTANTSTATATATATAPATDPNARPDSDSDYPSWVVTEQDRRRWRQRMVQRRYRARNRAAARQQEQEAEAERERSRPAIPIPTRVRQLRRPSPPRVPVRQPTPYPDEHAYYPQAGTSHNRNVTSFGITNTPLYRSYPGDGQTAFAYWRDHPVEQQQQAAAATTAAGQPVDPVAYSNSPAAQFEVQYANANASAPGPAPTTGPAPASHEPEVETAERRVRAVRFRSPLVTKVHHTYRR